MLHPARGKVEKPDLQCSLHVLQSLSKTTDHYANDAVDTSRKIAADYVSRLMT